MKFEEFIDNPKLERRLMKRLIVIISFTVLLIFTVFHFDKTWGVIEKVVSVISPFLTGIAVAFVLNVFVKLFEERVFAGLNKRNNRIWIKCRRMVCILLALIFIALLLTGILFYVIPELVRSVDVLTDNAPIYVNQTREFIEAKLAKWNVPKTLLNPANFNWSTILTHATQITSNFMGSLFSITMSVASGIFSFVMSFIFSIYMLSGKEKHLCNLKRTLYAFLPAPKAKRIIEVSSLTNKIFNGFVAGQLTESLIIGTLCYIGMTILRLPYALLIGCIICLSSLIPILGAYLGATIGGFILLIINPIYCLWFLIFLICLQQFEGNVIYPRVVGTSIGLPGIWVLFAIVVCGNLFGIVGILLGVPTFSVLHTLFRQKVRSRLNEKEITVDQILNKK